MNRERGNTPRARRKKGAAGEKKEGKKKRKKEKWKEKNNGKSRSTHKERERGKGRDSSVYYRFAEPVIIAGPRNAHRRPLILPLAILFSSLFIPHPSSGRFSLVLSSSPRPVPSSSLCRLYNHYQPLSYFFFFSFLLFSSSPFPFVPRFLFSSLTPPCPSFCSYRELPLILFLIRARPQPLCPLSPSFPWILAWPLSTASLEFY